MDHEELLSHLGLEPRAAHVYMALLSHGPSSVRSIASQTNINRGTTHQLLKSLIKEGLVSYYHKQKRQYFVAESPEKLLALSSQTVERVASAHETLKRELPQLKSAASGKRDSTIVRSFEGVQGARTVLKDVLDAMRESPDKLYRCYSSSAIREVLYQSYPKFTQERIAAGIFVRVIAIGAGGEHQELSLRRWLGTARQVPTYRILYHGRIAVLRSAQDNHSLHAVVIEDQAMYETEVLLFDQLWATLKS